MTKWTLNTMYYSLYHIFLSALVGPVLHNFVDACGRTPARTQPRPHTSAAPVTQTPTVSPTPPVTSAVRHHRQKCTAAEEREAGCLNGGECFALDLNGGNRSALCQCPELWEGQRCEQMSDDFFVLYAGQVKKAGIAAGVVVLVIILTIIIVYFAVKRRKKRKRNQDRGHREHDAQMNGNASQPLMKEAMHTDPERIALNGMEKTPETKV